MYPLRFYNVVHLAFKTNLIFFGICQKNFIFGGYLNNRKVFKSRLRYTFLNMFFLCHMLKIPIANIYTYRVYQECCKKKYDRKIFQIMLRISFVRVRSSNIRK